MTVSEAVPLSALNVCPLLTGMAIPQVTLRTVNNDAFDLNNAVSQGCIAFSCLILGCVARIGLRVFYE